MTAFFRPRATDVRTGGPTRGSQRGSGTELLIIWYTIWCLILREKMVYIAL